MKLFDKYLKKFLECKEKQKVTDTPTTLTKKVETISSCEILKGDSACLMKTARNLSSEGRPYAVKIRSKVLCEDVWVITQPDASFFLPDDEVYYLPEEIRNLRDSAPEEIRQVHMIKKKIGSCLMLVKERDTNV